MFRTICENPAFSACFGRDPKKDAGSRARDRRLSENSHSKALAASSTANSVSVSILNASSSSTNVPSTWWRSSTGDRRKANGFAPAFSCRLYSKRIGKPFAMRMRREAKRALNGPLTPRRLPTFRHLAARAAALDESFDRLLPDFASPFFHAGIGLPRRIGIRYTIKVEI
jgi:hypothetical protein